MFSFRNHFAAFISLSVLLGSGYVAADEEAGKQTGTPLVYKDAEANDPEIRKLWDGWGDGYLDEDVSTRYIVLSHFRDDKDRAVVVSQIGGTYVCGNAQCPTRIAIDGEIIEQGQFCDDLDSHLLVPSKAALFLCDIPVPLRTKADIENEKQQ